MLFLGEVGGESDGFAAGGFNGAAECQAADFAGGGDVALEEGGGEGADGDVVEAVAGVIGGKQGCRIDVHKEKVADGVLVFRAVEAPEGLGTAGVGMLRGGTVERR